MSPRKRSDVLKLDNVSLAFQTGHRVLKKEQHRVLQEVSFELYDGETLGIVGRNGVGKTTTLRVMAGILAPSSGVVTMRPGVHCALLTIGLGFKPDLSGRDNALLSAMLLGSTHKQACGFLEEIKSFSELQSAFEDPVKTYSAGMRMRLGFTTALMTEVDILLIDEVLAVGDFRFRAKAKEAMKRRIKSHQTVVLVSHNIKEVKELCDRVIWIKNGRIHMDGDPNNVLDLYKKYMKS